MSSLAPMLQVNGLTKSFFGVKAVDGVSFDVRKGCLLGVVGENGAGKSTLMNMLGGVVVPDAGEMTLEDQSYAPRRPRDAKQAGIAFIHQELNLFTNLSVAENLFIDQYPRLGGLPLIHRAALRKLAQRALEAVVLDVSPTTRVETLTPGERQLVEIAKAVNAEARLIIFDEPTTSLTNRETERLFVLLQKLKAEGTAIIYISHILADVLRLADDIMVLRDGTMIERGARKAFDTRRMISLMVGRDLEQLYPAHAPRTPAQPVLEVEGLTQPGTVRDITLRLHHGEILGVFGLMGSGRSELARILFGLDPYQSGRIKLGGRLVGRLTPREAIEQGVAFVTENRREEGLMMNASIADNMSLVTLTEDAKLPIKLIQQRQLATRVERLGGELKLKASSYQHPVKTLSGGNQQKVVLGKWLAAKPDVLIIDEPTRGIDVGAKLEVYTLVHNLAGRGTGVLFISSELDELIGVCDRLLVMHNGEIVASFSHDSFDREKILAAAFREAV